MTHLFQELTIKDVCKVFSGNSINEKEKAEKYEGIEEGIPYIATKDIGFDLEINYENGVRIPFASAANFKVAPTNTVFICAEGGSAGRKLSISDREVCFVNKLFALVSSKNILPMYLYYYLQSSFFKKAFEESLTGIIGGVSLNKFKALSIKVCSIESQKEIVATLNSKIQDIDSALINTKENILNSQRLLNNYSNEVFNYRGNDCREVYFSDVAHISSRLVSPLEEKYAHMLHIGAGNIESKSGKIHSLLTAKEEGLISGKFVFSEDMVLYSKIRPYLMKVVKPDFEGLCSADIYPLVAKPELLDRNYLYYLLLSNRFTEYAIEGSARAGMPKVNREHLFEYKFHIPSIEKQQYFSVKLDTLALETDFLEVAYKKKAEALKELKLTLINQAFNGTLN